MVLDFTIQAYTILAVYLLISLAVGFALYFTIKSTILSLRSLFKGSLKEGTPYQEALTS